MEMRDGQSDLHLAANPGLGTGGEKFCFAPGIEATP